MADKKGHWLWDGNNPVNHFIRDNITGEVLPTPRAAATKTAQVVGVPPVVVDATIGVATLLDPVTQVQTAIDLVQNPPTLEDLSKTIASTRDAMLGSVERAPAWSRPILRANGVYFVLRVSKETEANAETYVLQANAEAFKNAGGLEAEARYNAAFKAGDKEGMNQARKDIIRALQPSNGRMAQLDNGVTDITQLRFTSPDAKVVTGDILLPAAGQGTVDAARGINQDIARKDIPELLGLPGDGPNGEKPWYKRFGGYIAGGAVALFAGLGGKALMEGVAGWFSGGATLATGATSKITTILSAGLALGAGYLAYRVADDALNGESPDERRAKDNKAATAHLTRGLPTGSSTVSLTDPVKPNATPTPDGTANPAPAPAPKGR